MRDGKNGYSNTPEFDFLPLGRKIKQAREARGITREQLAEMLDSGVPIGRKLDFLIQEFNREANTIGSKCNDIQIARHVVDIKAEIEKIREQVQNIE